VYDDSTNKYHAIKNGSIIGCLIKSIGGGSLFGDPPGKSQELLKASTLEVSLNHSNFLVWLMKWHKC
jgi:hypothetical protein